ncbi:MAG: hypothetical protein AVDCRST_MAG27-3607 [uncultured Craurococcus sp.]|uniref:Uncharacterized protein n=1 Tax=uncultured Craurococcus sp. TaxID=1135998 RepID=A0A6J4JJ66_9PROT|nr:MAG: hypothetical protein AVDCRST_MAG27-3607 [uncultured Craurococcus sp.]
MTRPAPLRRRAWLALLLLAGCTGGGPQQLDTDQVGYAQALGDGLKRQMLLNMVRLRYADVPTFLSVSQVITGYTLQTTGQVGLNSYPNANPGNYATISGTMQYTTRPTFTFTPMTGEQFAQSYLRPLAAAELLSLAQSGAPVDLLFRLGVQSVNGMPNGATRGGEAQEASGGFLALVGALRQAQAAGRVGLRFERHGSAGRVFLLLEGDGPAVRQARSLLGLGPSDGEAEVTYGQTRGGRGQVAILTRSVLQVLYELGAQIEVAAADVARGDTRATEDSFGERLIRIRQGPRAPADAYAAVPYRERWFWIEQNDYRSKASFTFAYILQILAESGRGQPTPMVTIPAQ